MANGLSSPDIERLAPQPGAAGKAHGGLRVRANAAGGTTLVYRQAPSFALFKGRARL